MYEGNAPIYIDMRNIGSNNGIYSNPDIPITERATRLLMNTLEALHNGLYQYAVGPEEQSMNLHVVGPALVGSPTL